MMTKENIVGTINRLEENLKELKLEESKDYPVIVKRLIRNEIGNVGDNLYRYKMQARAWDLIK